MIFVSNQPLAGTNAAQAAMDFIVNEDAPLATTRRSSKPSTVSPHSSFFAHSHTLTRTASACHLNARSHVKSCAACHVNNQSSITYYELHSALRSRYAGYLPISIIKSTSRDASTANQALKNTLTLQDAQKLKEQQRVQAENAQAASLVG